MLYDSVLVKLDVCTWQKRQKTVRVRSEILSNNERQWNIIQAYPDPFQRRNIIYMAYGIFSKHLSSLFQLQTNFNVYILTRKNYYSYSVVEKYIYILEKYTGKTVDIWKNDVEMEEPENFLMA